MKYIDWIFRIICSFFGHDWFYDEGFRICSTCRCIKQGYK